MNQKFVRAYRCVRGAFFSFRPDGVIKEKWRIFQNFINVRRITDNNTSITSDVPTMHGVDDID